MALPALPVAGVGLPVVEGGLVRRVWVLEAVVPPAAVFAGKQ